MNVYLDMDGVIVDFIGGCLKVFGKDHLTPEHITEYSFYRKWGISDKEFWETISGKEFWESLDWTLWGKDFFNSLCALERSGDIDRLEIVTRPNFDFPGTVEGKLAWINKNIPGFERISFTRDKHLMAKTGILIDDGDKNYEEFVKAGGKAILFPQPWNCRGSDDFPDNTVYGELMDLIYEGHTNKAIFEEPEDNEVMSEDASTGGKKAVKTARYDLIPTDPLRLLAKQYGLGTMKYGDRNWEKGYAWSKSFASANRHLWQFWKGEDVDEETKNLHIIAAAWHCFALAEFYLRGSGTDDRPRNVSLEAGGKVGGNS